MNDSFIKIHWEKVFGAAVDKEVKLSEQLAKEKEEFVEAHSNCTTGCLFWKRKYTPEEIDDMYEYSNFARAYTQSLIRKAKKLQTLAIQSSTEYASNNDYVYLTTKDANFLFD